MFDFVKKFHKDEAGITALETAIILIAFIVVASVFAYTILSAGTASTERGQEAIYAGLEEVQSSMEIKGAVIAQTSTAGAAATVESLVFTVGSVAGGEPIDLTDTTGTNAVVISYRDSTQFESGLPWTVEWVVPADGSQTDELLDPGELAQITVDVSALSLSANTEFNLEIKPPSGAVIQVNRTTPAFIDLVTELH
jgi:flagellin FlaB